ncbi:MAG: serine hydrolase domain-containing protein [Myxococcota bacterium]
MGRAPFDRVRSEVCRLLDAGVRGNVFPGGVGCVAWFEENKPVYAVGAAGRLSGSGPKTHPLTPYDLASLTKPFVAVTALGLVAAGKLDLDQRADSIVPDVRGGKGGRSTIEQLLTHRSGLAAWGGFYLDVPHESGTGAARRWILGEAARRVEGPADAQVVYSDLGYIIAGEVIGRVEGPGLAAAVEKHVTSPLSIDSAVYFAGNLSGRAKSKLASTAAPTERCEWRGRLVVGEVHDENAAALGGIAGHAGLFGTAEAVATFGCETLVALDGRSTVIDRDLLVAALAERPGGTHRLGFDGKTGTDSAAGKRMGPRAYGHLGFTGTSLWCDPDRRVVVVLLTNRVHPTRANQKIRGFRPAFHDGVLAALG